MLLDDCSCRVRAHSALISACDQATATVKHDLIAVHCELTDSTIGCLGLGLLVQVVKHSDTSDRLLLLRCSNLSLAFIKRLSGRVITPDRHDLLLLMRSGILLGSDLYCSCAVWLLGDLLLSLLSCLVRLHLSKLLMSELGLLLLVGPFLLVLSLELLLGEDLLRSHWGLLLLDTELWVVVDCGFRLLIEGLLGQTI